MGCWAIGGPFYSGPTPLGYSNTDDEESVRAIEAALDAGIRFFDTAAVYGTGHSERILGRALGRRDDVYVATKIGLRFDEEQRQVHGETADPQDVLPAIEASLQRLGRDHIDLLFLHLNSLPVDEALPLFDRMDEAVSAGKVRTYGWSTDFPDRVEAIGDRDNLAAIEHAANVLFSAPLMFPVLERRDLLSVVRSPLAMGVLTGKYRPGGRVAADDVRSNNMDWMDWFHDGAVAPGPAASLEAVRECLQIGGRTLAQGALAWLWARSPATMPIPGFRSVHQVIENTGALELGPLPAATMQEIEELLDRSAEQELRER
jgi:aryl-alcohol dehydrogenase-like predicted oxidoreductase